MSISRKNIIPVNWAKLYISSTVNKEQINRFLILMLEKKNYLLDVLIKPIFHSPISRINPNGTIRIPINFRTVLNLPQ